MFNCDFQTAIYSCDMARAHINFRLEDYQELKDAWTWDVSDKNSENYWTNFDLRENAYSTAVCGFQKLCGCPHKDLQLIFKVKKYGALVRIGLRPHNRHIKKERQFVVFGLFYEWRVESPEDVARLQRKFEVLYKRWMKAKLCCQCPTCQS